MDVETENEDDAKEESGDEAEPEMKEAEKPEPEVAKNLGQPESAHAAAPTKALRMRECPVCKVTKILWLHEKSPNAKSPTLLTLDLY